MSIEGNHIPRSFSALHQCMGSFLSFTGHFDLVARYLIEFNIFAPHGEFDSCTSVYFLQLKQVNYYWNNLTPGQKATVGIMGINLVVFMFWKFGPIREYMLTYFASNPMSSESKLISSCNFSSL